MGVIRYLADKSALARLHLPAVREELEPLMTRALVGICGVTELEMLYSARNIQERARMKEQLEASLDPVDTPHDIWERAAEIQEALTEQAQHRSASIPDLIVAATARARGLEILHYDRDIDTIARFTDQPTRWMVPPGTVQPGVRRASCRLVAVFGEAGADADVNQANEHQGEHGLDRQEPVSGVARAVGDRLGERGCVDVDVRLQGTGVGVERAVGIVGRDVDVVTDRLGQVRLRHRPQDTVVGLVGAEGE